MTKRLTSVFIVLLAINTCYAVGNDKMKPFDYKIQTLEFWEKHLTGETLQVCRFAATEKAGSGQYDFFYEIGQYNCACCGGDHPLFSSDTKFDSKTGWPSFYKPLEGGVIEKPDPKDVIRGFFNIARTEVVCARCESHLGHVFNDGPPPTGKRYCMNSAALRFVADGKPTKRTYEVDN